MGIYAVSPLNIRVSKILNRATFLVVVLRGSKSEFDGFLKGDTLQLGDIDFDLTKRLAPTKWRAIVFGPVSLRDRARIERSVADAVPLYPLSTESLLDKLSEKKTINGFHAHNET
jgi:hypothetical protein